MHLLCSGMFKAVPRLAPLFTSTIPLKSGSMGEYSMQ